VVNALLDKDGEKQILGELSDVYHSAIEPMESLYQYKILGVSSFTGTLILLLTNYNNLH